MKLDHFGSWPGNLFWGDTIKSRVLILKVNLKCVKPKQIKGYISLYKNLVSDRMIF